MALSLLHSPTLTSIHDYWKIAKSLCCPPDTITTLLLNYILLTLNLSQYQGLSNELALHIRWPKYWSFSINLSNEYSVLISFRIDWFDLLAVQGTLKGLPQHHSLKASILWCSSFFMLQLSHPYMTIGKAIALTIQKFGSKMMSLLFNMLSSYVIAFLPRSKYL